jgi:inhibitor of cysteine peptidase
MKKARFFISTCILLISLTACFPGNVNSPGNLLSGNMVRGQVYLGEMQLLIMESYPVQISLHISGDLPTPCHTFSYSMTEPNEKMEIHIDAFSIVEDGVICVQMIQPFEWNVSIPMTGRADGVYTVWVNGEKVGEFAYPG